LPPETPGNKACVSDTGPLLILDESRSSLKSAVRSAGFIEFEAAGSRLDTLAGILPTARMTMRVASLYDGFLEKFSSDNKFADSDF